MFNFLFLKKQREVFKRLSRLNGRSVSILSFFIIVYFLFLFSEFSYAQATGSPSYKLTGNAEITSHFVYHGLSQTNKDPALIGSFWFNFGPQFRLGLWGSNVNYSGNDTHLWLRINADVKVDFSSETNLTISYSQNQYYKSNSRNGNTVALDLNMYTYHVIYQIESDWEGTETSSQYYAFAKDFPVFSSWIWKNQVGYSMLKANAYTNYFDLRTALETRFKDIYLTGTLTATSASSQFDGRGDYFTLFSIRADF